MVTNLKRYFFLILLTGLISQPLFAQESILKEFAEDNNKRKFCLYPSTLRMVNISNEPEFNALIEPIEKLLFYSLDSASTASKSYRQVLTDYTDNGYEEYAQVYGGDYDVHILGKKRDVLEWVGILKQDQEAFAFYLTGPVNWQKIPMLLDTMQENELINLFEIGQNGRNRD